MKYQVYVIELSKKVFSENRKFRTANPQYNPQLECLYVGMTSKDIKERFLQHKHKAKSKKGHNLASSIVFKYGLYLRPSLYTAKNPIKSRRLALIAEEELALSLRRQGYAVWFN